MQLRCNYCGTKHKVSNVKLHFHTLRGTPYYFYCKNCLLCNCIKTYLRAYHDSTDKKEKSINKTIMEHKIK